MTSLIILQSPENTNHGGFLSVKQDLCDFFFHLDWLAHLELKYSVVNTPWLLYVDLDYAFLIIGLIVEVVVWAHANLVSDYSSGFEGFFPLIKPLTCSTNWLWRLFLCRAGHGVFHTASSSLSCAQRKRLIPRVFSPELARQLLFSVRLNTNTHSQFHVGPFPRLWPFPLLSFRPFPSGPGPSWGQCLTLPSLPNKLHHLQTIPLFMHACLSQNCGLLKCHSV